MWDTVTESSTPLSHDLPCPRCAHGGHHYLPCDHCACAGDGVSTYDGRRNHPSLAIV
jgi:hypothetical protein